MFECKWQGSGKAVARQSRQYDEAVKGLDSVSEFFTTAKYLILLENAIIENDSCRNSLQFDEGNEGNEVAKYLI